MTLEALYEKAFAAQKRGALEEAEGLYRQLLAAAPKSFAARHMLGVLRAQQGDSAEALALIGDALRRRPDAPDAHFNLGNILLGLGRDREALASYDAALALCPDYPGARARRAQALTRQAMALHAAKAFDAALAEYDRALADPPQDSEIHNNRAATLWAVGRYVDALEGFDRALALNPEYVEAHFNRGNALQSLLRLDEAIASYDRALVLDGKFASAIANKAIALLLKGDFAGGLPLYEMRKALVPQEQRHYPQPLWTGAEDIAGKTLFLYAEQGLGDTIQFVRFVAPVIGRGARVILAVPDRLLALLGSAPWEMQLLGNRGVRPQFDYHCALMSLPLALDIRLETIPAETPYLKAQDARVLHWAQKIGQEGFKIGVAWQGDLAGAAGRALPLAALAPLSGLPGLRLISLQKGLGAEQLQALPAGMAVESLGPDFDAGPDAFLDSAAVMQSLDLVITPDTAIAHLAGALGRPVWVGLKRVPDWRWLLGRTDSPWYPGMRLFRQTQDGDWDGVIAAMEQDLKRMIP